MSPTQPLPPKKEVGLALLERSSVYVHLDPRQDTVVVPAWFKKQAQLVLQVGMNMPVAIPDLRFDDDGMSCTLSFNRSPFFCVVPWSSVFAMVGEDGRGMVWPDDVPAEVTRHPRDRPAEDAARKDAPKAAVATARETRESKPEAPKAKRARKRPALSAVPDGGSKTAPVKSTSSSGRASPSPVRPVIAPSPSAGPRPVAGPTRKRRELPPYIRVVK